MPNVYEIITDRIVAMLDKGEIPWRKPWTSLGPPKNLISGRDYRGINRFMLSLGKFSSPYWITRKQIFAKGGAIRKGERSMPVIFWKVSDSKTETDKSGRPKKMFLLRYYNVWNAEQTSGIEYPKPEPIIHEPIPECESVVANMPNRPTIEHGGDRACYAAASDVVTMPPMTTFDLIEGYYATIFHELSHATGHKSRVGRDLSSAGRGTYAREELVAEMSQAFLCAVCGIEMKTIENTAAYIQNWMKAIKSDPKLLVTAAGRAQKSADYILDRQPETTGDSTEDKATTVESNETNVEKLETAVA